MAEGEQPFWRGWQGPAVFLSRLLWCTAAWWVLSGGAAASWPVGAPAVVGAALLSAWLLPPLRWSWRGALSFWVYFLRESVRGGVEVAWRALDWRVPVDPGLFEYRCRLQQPAARVALANTASLLPGSLIADVDGSRFYVHALNAADTATVRGRLQQAEAQVAGLFSLSLDGPASPRGRR